MNETKITFIIVMIAMFTMFHIKQWMDGDKANYCPEDDGGVCFSRHLHNITQDLPKPSHKGVKTAKPVRTDVCHAIDVLTLKEKPRCYRKRVAKTEENTTATAFTAVFLLILSSIKSVHDVMRERREEAARMEREPEGSRRRSLAEFADKKTIRRSSSKMGSQLVLIAENDVNKEPTRKHVYTRGDSSNSYLSEKIVAHGLADGGPVSLATNNDSPATDRRLPQRGSPIKLFGARPAPMVRRSSFPVLPMNPDIRNLIHQDRRPSICDSDDETDGKTRRVRLIRRH